jgi:class 3 adenylate cyclase
MSYWISESPDKAFCLVEAPDAESLAACHKRAHGLMPHSIVEVDSGTIDGFLGDTEKDSGDRATLDGAPDSGLRTIMFTDLQGSTDVSVSRGDLEAVALVREHDDIVRSAVRVARGREIKHTGDGLLVSFASVIGAVRAAVEIQRSCAGRSDLRIKVGLSAGEPVEEADDLYGAAVNLAARICAHASGGEILVSGTVRDLAMGKDLPFSPRGAIALKGFPEPVTVYEVTWT